MFLRFRNNRRFWFEQKATKVWRFFENCLRSFYS